MNRPLLPVAASAVVSMLAVAGVPCRPAIAVAQEAGVAAVLPPVRPRLQEVPLPRLDTLESAVADQLRAALGKVEHAAGGDTRDRDLADAYGSLGQLFHVYEFFDSAEPAYANAMRLASGEIRWRYLLGYLYEQTGRLEKAADQFAAIQRLQPDHREAAVHLGEVYLRLNRLTDARVQFEKILRTFPAVGHHGLGQVALRERRFDEAVDHFTAVLERMPQATSVHYSLAMAYRGLGRLDEARAHLQQQGGGGVRAADAEVDGLQTLVHGERALVMQGRRAYEAGQFEAAADAFSRAIREAPGSATPRVNLGLALSRLGDAVGAAGQFEAALRLDAGDAIAHASLGRLLVQQGRHAEGVDHLRAAFDLAPDDGDITRELLGALLRLGRGEDAIELIERVRSFAPEDEGVLIGLSILLADSERYAKAVSLLDQANRRFPERTATATTLARLLASSPDRSLRDGGRAHELAMAVYASEPTPVHGETVAMSLAEMGRCEEASAWMRRAVAAAEEARDAEEVARLRGELPKYETASCRPAPR